MRLKQLQDMLAMAGRRQKWAYAHIQRCLQGYISPFHSVTHLRQYQTLQRDAYQQMQELRDQIETEELRLAAEAAAVDRAERLARILADKARLKAAAQLAVTPTSGEAPDQPT